MTNSIDTSAHSCDTCTYGHRKCDRKKPSCDTCIDLKEQCSYTRKPKHTKKLHFIENNINNFKVNINNKSNINDIKKTRVRYKTKIIKLPACFNNPYTPLGILNSITNKNLFENLMTIFLYPSPLKSSIGLSFILKISEGFKVYIKQQSSDKKQMVVEKEFQSWHPVLKQAYAHFFNTSNKSYPLFIQSKFDFDSKSNTLKLCILLAGLYGMESNEVIAKIIKFIVNELYKELGTPYRIKLTLQNIQSVFIMITGCYKTEWITPNIERYLHFLTISSSSIGLHLTPNDLPLVCKIERVMLYSVMNLFSINLSLSFGSSIILPYRPKILNLAFKKVLNSLFLKRRPNYSACKVDFDFCYSIVITSFFNELSSITFAIRVLKDEYVSLDKTQIVNELKIEQLIERIQKLEKNYLIIFTSVEIQFDLKMSYEHYKLLLICNYYIYFILSLKFYNSSKSYQFDRAEFICNDSNYITKVLIQGYLTLYYCLKLPANYLTNIELGMALQVVIFLARFKHKSEVKVDTIIQKYLNSLKYLLTIGTVANVAYYNIELASAVLYIFNAKK
ncbi:hypothetical protein K502DRAFT_343235 [Neoconidiobolus thromboides FSU 785]|nr:hypothetical protein K502DRAFT_343235 [Neoconidiobolus thromboides FSU 785]